MSTSAVLNTQYSLSSFKIRVRAFNAAGAGEYSNASSGTVAWTNVTGTDTQTDTVCGPSGCSETDTDTVCGPAGCSESQSQNCECGTQSRSRTRTSSRTRTRSRTSSRTRSRTTQQYTRLGSTSSTITYGSYGAYTDYTYSAWSAYSAYSGYTYSDWSAYSGWSACSGGTQVDITYDTNYIFTTQYVANRGWYIYYSIWGWYWSDSAGNPNITCDGGSGLAGPSVVYRCNITGTVTTNAAGSDTCIYPTYG